MFAQSFTSVASANRAANNRPEFQLVEVTNPKGFKSQSGMFVPCGTIYGRLYFAHNCEPVGGTFKGKVIFDSRKSGGDKRWHNPRRSASYEIHFICPDPNEYARLLKVCNAPNMAINRVRTAKLVRELVANHTNVVQFPKQQAVVKQQSATRPLAVAMPNHLAEVPSAARKFPRLACPWKRVQPKSGVVTRTTLCYSPYPKQYSVNPALLLPPAKVEDVQPTANTSKYSFMQKYKPHTLRVRVCKRFGILTTGVSDAHIHEYTINQMAKRNISVAAIKAIFK